MWIAYRNCLRLTKKFLGRKGFLPVEPQSRLPLLILLNEAQAGLKITRFFSDRSSPNCRTNPAARDKRGLVIFAGAGVSYCPPSTLPLFQGLVDQLAEHSATL